MFIISFSRIFHSLFIGILSIIFCGALLLTTPVFIHAEETGEVSPTSPASAVKQTEQVSGRQARSQSTSAQFTPLAGIPGITDSAPRTLAEYLNALFRIAIGLGAIIAVIKITIAGIKYMGNDSVFSKEEAKKDITSALLGLLLMLSTVLILGFIFPGILNLNILQGIKPVQIQTSSFQNPPRETTRPLTSSETQTAAQTDTKVAEALAENRVVSTIRTAGLGREPEAIAFAQECTNAGNSIYRTNRTAGVTGSSTMYCISPRPVVPLSETETPEAATNRAIETGNTIVFTTELPYSASAAQLEEVRDRCQAAGGGNISIGESPSGTAQVASCFRSVSAPSAQTPQTNEAEPLAAPTEVSQNTEVGVAPPVPALEALPPQPLPEEVCTGIALGCRTGKAFGAVGGWFSGLLTD